MPPKTKKSAMTASAEVQKQQSPAEFFADHQAIAGYDNAGKSLYTTIRELVENSLDAAESIGQLPSIHVSIQEYTTEQFNALQKQEQRGGSVKWKDLSSSIDSTAAAVAAATPASKKKTSKKRKADHVDSDDEQDEAASPNDDGKANKKETKTGKASSKKKPPSRSAEAYFCLTVKDNGCGMKHADIPHLLGRVLSGTKQGVRQTRGKFGLGAKMALIWAKKSTGVPVRLQTAHRLQADATPPTFSRCVLDIDIAKNQPKILMHTQSKNNNSEPWQGTQLQVWIAGNWTTYRGRITQYFQQLAIITPYAVLELQYDNASDPHRAYHLRYDRRSEQMPPLAQTVMHHPASVNNLVMQQLRDSTKRETLLSFLTSELAGVSPAVAKKVLQDVIKRDDTAKEWATPDTHPRDLSDGNITRLVQVLRSVSYFKAPDGQALSPLGEYNLNLGIRKVLEPDLVATARDKPGAYEGHSFLVEAAVSLGGGGKNNSQNNTVLIKEEGITVCRFANRIPLLFEGGADVVTRVALGKIRWSQYKMDPKRDKIGVFVSIVSTKIPFKGTSKEYIGDDATAIQVSVKRALQSCCQQLRVHLTKQQAFKDAQQRKSRLTKYIPDVGRSLYGILSGMRERQQQLEAGTSTSMDDVPRHSPAKRLRVNKNEASAMMKRLEKKEVTEEVIVKALRDAIQDETAESEEKRMAEVASKIPLFMVPLYNLEDQKHDVKHAQGLFTFRPLVPIERRIVSPSASFVKMKED
eukprot:scaffold1127_cov160-Amphora_coffeaeformis.AAC.15